MNTSVVRGGAPGGAEPPAVPVELVDLTPSTQDLAARRRAEGRAAPFAVLAAQQSAARGRLGRRFSSPAGGALALTVVHESALALGDRSWFPLALGVAALDALHALPGVAAGLEAAGLGLKWPNDLHTAAGGKLGGILVEGRGAGTVLLGIGLNLHGPIHGEDGTEVPGAVWLHGPGGLLDDEGGEGLTAAEVPALRDALAAGIASRLVLELEALEASGGDASATGLDERFAMTCVTLGRDVRVEPLGHDGPRGAAPLTGRAVGIDDRGRLLVDPGPEQGGVVAVDVGDVRHLRAVRGSGGTMAGPVRNGHDGEEAGTR
ncbi:biotin--[acetyl-CoA-carboxylase] ligase [Brachybacterium squillarum]|uniref:biotin--[acetyl-CoA-carboxylase] ligase n=1 Tax=Brachybacterium squillarum TaxID=661979 RepID=UPI0022218E3B|nr:biotin--[acetyl-CoA-carboxylase] ligase [Brachybacterium squillarum]MCW1804827.1 biotin--[acetyl-CoA-carboxylase] ligase [Brachybacterium squillarum]